MTGFTSYDDAAAPYYRKEAEAEKIEEQELKVFDSVYHELASELDYEEAFDELVINEEEKMYVEWVHLVAQYYKNKIDAQTMANKMAMMLNKVVCDYAERECAA